MMMPNNSEHELKKSVALTRLEETLHSLTITPRDRSIIETFKHVFIGLDSSSPRPKQLVEIWGIFD
jgi:hypothetical protein